MFWLLDCLWPKNIISISWLNFEIRFSQFGVCKKTKIPKKTFGQTVDTILSKFLIGFRGGCVNRGSHQNGTLPRCRWRTRFVVSFERTCWPFHSDPLPRDQHKTRNHDIFRNFCCCLKLPKDKLEKKLHLKFYLFLSFLFQLFWLKKFQFSDMKAKEMPECVIVDRQNCPVVNAMQMLLQGVNTTGHSGHLYVGLFSGFCIAFFVTFTWETPPETIYISKFEVIFLFSIIFPAKRDDSITENLHYMVL